MMPETAKMQPGGNPAARHYDDGKNDKREELHAVRGCSPPSTSLAAKCSAIAPASQMNAPMVSVGQGTSPPVCAP